MKSFFSRLHDTQTGHSKPASRDSYKFWTPNADPDRDASKPPPTTRLHGEKRSSSRAPKPSQSLPMPPYDKPAPNTAVAGPSTDHATYPTGRPTPAVSSTQYSQVYSQAPSKATSTRHRDYDDGKPQPPPRTPSRQLYSTRTYLPQENPVKNTRHGNLRAETTAPVQHEIWLPTNVPSMSKQGEDQQQNQEGKEALERYRSRNDEKERPIESTRRERERDRPKERERDRGRERGAERERIRHPTRDRDPERVARESERDRERQRTRDQDREREREREKELEEEGARERERELAREAEREQQQRKEREQERQQREKEREQREREREREKEREQEQERQQLEKERQRERDRQLEKERQREQERQQLEREREQEQERQQLERERQRERERQLEKERQREQERQHLEKEREREQERQQREKDREREKEKEKERERYREQREKERARHHERDRREREKEREREKYRMKEQDYEREKERDEKEKGKDRKSEVTRGSPNTKGKERAREEDTVALDVANKIGHPDRALADATRTDARNQNRDFQKEKDGQTSRDPYKSRERDREHLKYRAEATDGEQDLRRSKPRTQDRDKRRETNPGWMSDNLAAHERKSSRQVITQEPAQIDEGESSDNSIRAKVGSRLLQRRNRIDDVGSSTKLRSVQDRPSENTDPLNPLASNHPQPKVLPDTPDIQPLVSPTPLRMPVHLPPRESRTADRPLQQIVKPESSNEPEVPMRREINRLKLGNRQDDPPQQLLESHPKPVEPTISAHRRPPSRASVPHFLPSSQTITSQTPRIGPTFLPQPTIVPQTPRIDPTLLPQTKHVQPPTTTTSATASLIPETVTVTNQFQSRSDWAKDQRSYLERPFDVPSVNPISENPPINQATIPNPQTLERNPKPIRTTPSVVYNSVSRIDTQTHRQEPPLNLQPNANVAVFMTTVDHSSQPFSQLHAGQSKESQGRVVHNDTLRTTVEPFSRAPPVPVSSDIRYSYSRQREPLTLLSTLAKDTRTDTQFVAEPDNTRPSSRAQHSTPLMQATTIKLVQTLDSASQAHTGLSVQRPPTASGYRDGSRQYVKNLMPLASLSTDIPESLPTFSHSERKVKPMDTSNTGRAADHQRPWTGLIQNRTETVVPPSAPNPAEYLSAPRLAPSDIQSKAPDPNPQERVGMSISRPPTGAGIRQDTAKTFVPSDSQFKAVDMNMQEQIGMSITRPSSSVGFRQDNSNTVLPSDNPPKVPDWSTHERIGISTARPSTNAGFRQDNTNTLNPLDSQLRALELNNQERIGISLPRPSTNAGFRPDNVKPVRHHGPSNTHSNTLPEAFQDFTIVQTSSSHGVSNRINLHDDGRRTYSSQHMDVQNVDPSKEVFPSTGDADAISQPQHVTSRPVVPAQKRGSMGLSNQQPENLISVLPNMGTIIPSQSLGVERESPRARDHAINVGSDQNVGTSTFQVSIPPFSKKESPRTTQQDFVTVAPQSILPEHPTHQSTRGSKRESPRIPESRPTVSPPKAMAISITDEAEPAASTDLKLESPDRRKEMRSSGAVSHDPAARLKQEVVQKLPESTPTSSSLVPQMKIYRTLTSIVPQYDPEIPSAQLSGFVSPPTTEPLPQPLPLPVSSSKPVWGVTQAIQPTPSSAENTRLQPSPRHRPDESSARRSEPKNIPPEEEERTHQENRPNYTKTSVQFESGIKHRISDTPVNKDTPSLGFFTTTFSSALNASIDKKAVVENLPLKSNANERTNSESRESRLYVTNRDGVNRQMATVKANEPLLGLRDTMEPKNSRTDENHVDFLRSYKTPIPSSLISRKEFEVNLPLNAPLIPSHPPKISHPILAEILSSPPPKSFTNIHVEPVVPPTVILETNWSSVDANANVPQTRNAALEREQKNTDTRRLPTSQIYAGDSHPKVVLEQVHGRPKDIPSIQDNPPSMIFDTQPIQPITHGRDTYNAYLAAALPPSRVPSSSNQPERELMNTDTFKSLTAQRYISDSAKVILEHGHEPPKNTPSAQDNRTPPSKASGIQPAQTIAQAKDVYAVYPSSPSRVPTASNQPPVAIYPTLVKQDVIPTGDGIRPRNGAVGSGSDSTQVPSHSQDRLANILYNAPITQPLREHRGLPPESHSQKAPSQAFMNPLSAPLAQNFATSHASSHPANRHHHSASLPNSFVPSSAIDPLTTKDDFSRSRSPAHQPQFIPFQSELGRNNPTREKTTVSLPQAPSEETILMTPSSLAQSMMLKPTVSRQSVTPSTSSQTAKKGGGILSMFRKTPIQPPAQQYEIWNPNLASKTPDSSPGHSKALHTPPGLQPEPPSPRSRRVDAAADFSIPVPIHGRDERKASHSHVFTPFRYLTTKRNRAGSVTSVEAQDGTAPNTVVGSPTASMHSQAPIQPPPLRDPWLATEEWRNKEEADAKLRAKAKLRRQRPGVVFDVGEDQPEDSQKRPRRTRTRYRSSGKKTETPQA